MAANSARRLSLLTVRAATAVLLSVGLVPAALGADGAGPDSDFFEKKVRPVLVDHCYKCHSAEAEAGKKLKAGLFLDTREGMLKGGEGGPVIVPGEPDKSRLIEAVRYHNPDLQMPPKGPRLTDEQVADLAAWVKAGAPDPRTSSATQPAAPVDMGAATRHWSFQPPKQHAVPDVRRADWPKSAIDHFILAKLEQSGLTPAPPADKRTLIRRATFDLTGLPPTPQEVRAFLDDDSADAFGKVVDRLLASPAYGERWGRHWLDVVRYADTAGDGADYPVREAYKYRNYVIDSFNRDKPYDQFLREQIAGDVLAAEGPAEKYAERVIATGYLAVSKRFGYRADSTGFRHLDLADAIEVVGKSVLGLSVGCARCHDHKYDPVSMADYYALYGILDSSTFTFPGGEEQQRPADLVPLVPPAGREGAEKQWRAAVAELDAKAKAAEAERTRLKSQPATAPAAPEALAAAEKEARNIKRQRDELAATPPYEVAYGVVEGKPADAKIQLRGEPNRRGPLVRRGFLKVLGGQQLPEGSKGSGRLELAGWLTDPKNPLTARVMVNRIWQHHFGRGIVATPSDFGARGSPPTHPELLDLLALRFVEKGWSIKAMHREILLSAAYQVSCEDQPAGLNSDPENKLLWKFSRRRLEAEAIRDAMLAVSGNLDRTMGGEHPFPPVSKWGFTIHNPFYAVYETNRRSVYLMVQRQKKHPFLSLFDGADPNVSTDERVTTVTPAQALYLMNDPFVHEQSAGLARRLLAEAKDDAGRVRRAHELATGREPAREDVGRALEFVKQYGEKLAALGKPPEEGEPSAWAAYARVLLTSNTFLFVE
jgi:cytochrome c553